MQWCFRVFCIATKEVFLKKNSYLILSLQRCHFFFCSCFCLHLKQPTFELNTICKFETSVDGFALFFFMSSQRGFTPLSYFVFVWYQTRSQSAMCWLSSLTSAHFSRKWINCNLSAPVSAVFLFCSCSKVSALLCHMSHRSVF